MLTAGGRAASGYRVAPPSDIGDALGADMLGVNFAGGNGSGTASTSSSIGTEQAAKQAAVADAVNLNPPLRLEDVTVRKD